MRSSYITLLLLYFEITFKLSIDSFTKRLTLQVIWKACNVGYSMMLAKFMKRRNTVSFKYFTGS